MRRIGRTISTYIHWLSQICFESVAVASALFSLIYGSRLLLLGSFFSYPTDTLIAILSKTVPVQEIGFAMVIGSLVNLFSVYTLYRYLLSISLYGLFFIWVLLLLSFIPIGWLALHSCIAIYMVIVYYWAIWKTRGLISPSSP